LYGACVLSLALVYALALLGLQTPASTEPQHYLKLI